MSIQWHFVNKACTVTQPSLNEMSFNGIERICVSGNVEAEIDGGGILRGCSTARQMGTSLIITGYGSIVAQRDMNVINIGSDGSFSFTRNPTPQPRSFKLTSSKVTSLTISSNASLKLSPEILCLNDLTVTASGNSAIQLPRANYEKLMVTASGNSSVVGNSSRVNHLWLEGSGNATIINFNAVKYLYLYEHGNANVYASPTADTCVEKNGTIIQGHRPNDNQEDSTIDSRDGDCVVCYLKNATQVTYPCFHSVACNDCLAKIKTCPVCRAKIEITSRVFKS